VHSEGGRGVFVPISLGGRGGLQPTRSWVWARNRASWRAAHGEVVSEEFVLADLQECTGAAAPQRKIAGRRSAGKSCCIVHLHAVLNWRKIEAQRPTAGAAGVARVEKAPFRAGAGTNKGGVKAGGGGVQVGGNSTSEANETRAWGPPRSPRRKRVDEHEEECEGGF